MKILTLVKEVPDPDGIFNLGADNSVSTQQLARLPGVFDENALEAAIQLKEKHGGKVTVLSLGPPSSDKTMTHCYAMGADEVVLIEALSGMEWEPYVTAAVLATGIKKLGDFDLIIAGRESSDSGFGIVGPLVARHLDIPFLTLVKQVEKCNDSLRIQRLAEGGYDVFECNPPVLLTVTSEINVPRYPSVLKVLQAKKKMIHRWQINDLNLDMEKLKNAEQKITLVTRYAQMVSETCSLIGGNTEEEKALGLLNTLREERLI